MVRVGIVGATGYAGAELVRILSGHPQVELSILTSRQFAGVKFDRVYPALAGCVNLTCEELDVDVAELLEDGICFGYLFWGLLFCTLLNVYPSSLILTRMVSSLGNSSSVYPFWAISCLRTSATLKRVKSRVVLNVGSVWLCSSRMALMSSNR